MRLALYFSSVTLSLTLGLAGCDGAASSAAPPTVAPTGPGTASSAAAKTAEPVLAEALARSQARWDVIVDAEWIQAYDFLTPDRKRQESLSEFLRSKDNHEYKNPSVPRLLGGDPEQDQAFVEVSVLWTPHHPILKQADNHPGDLTEQLDVVETWQWIDGEWYWIGVERQKDFLKVHPNLGG